MSAPATRIAVQQPHRAGAQSTRLVTTVGFAAAAYVVTVVAANYTSSHWSVLVVGPLLIPAGTLWAGVAFTVRDLLHELLGTAGVAGAVVGGTALSWLLASSHIAAASVVAFAASESLDSLLYARLRHHSRLRAVLGSNMLGLVVDSLLFVPLAFSSLAAVPGQIAGKTVATVVTVVLLSIVWRRRHLVVSR